MIVPGMKKLLNREKLLLLLFLIIFSCMGAEVMGWKGQLEKEFPKWQRPCSSNTVFSRVSRLPGIRHRNRRQVGREGRPGKILFLF